MVPAILFVYALFCVVLVVNALRSPKPPTHPLPPLWLPAMITSEAGGLWLTTMLGVWGLGWSVAESLLGRIALGVLATAIAGQFVIWLRSHRGARIVGPVIPHQGPLPRRITSRPPLPRVDRTRMELGEHPYRDEPLTMDLYRASPDPAPLVIYAHGGGWRGGNPRQAGQFPLQHLAENGWAVAAVEYPLSPAATFPDHLLGIDLALQWAQEDSRIVGPVVLMGGSAGAHLAAVAALTRPGISGLIGLYGIYDMVNRHRTRHDWPLIPRLVMKTTPGADPDAYRKASPIDLVNGSAPPTLLVAGSYDSLVPPAETDHFADALRNNGAPVTVVKVPWAQHGFDTLAGPRTRAVSAVMADWLATAVLANTDHPSPPEGRG